MAAKLKKHEENAVEILRELHKLGSSRDSDDFSNGWNEAISETVRIVERVTKISMEDAVWNEEDAI